MQLLRFCSFGDYSNGALLCSLPLHCFAPSSVKFASLSVIYIFGHWAARRGRPLKFNKQSIKRQCRQQNLSSTTSSRLQSSTEAQSGTVMTGQGGWRVAGAYLQKEATTANARCRPFEKLSSSSGTGGSVIKVMNRGQRSVARSLTR